jgi:hypothetical protein
VATIKKHHRLLAACVLVVALMSVLTGALLTEARTAALVEDDMPPLGLTTWAHLAEVRESLCLLPGELASARVAEDQAESLFKSLRMWCEQNELRLIVAGAEVRTAQRALRETLRKAHAGSEQVTLDDVKSRREHLDQAKVKQQALWEEFLPSLSSHIDAESQAVLATVRANRDATPQSYRATPRLEEQQTQGLRDAVARYGSGSDRTRQIEQRLLASSQREALNQAAQSRKQHIQGILAAEARVLVAPPELQLEDLSAEPNPDGV